MASPDQILESSASATPPNPNVPVDHVVGSALIDHTVAMAQLASIVGMDDVVGSAPFDSLVQAKKRRIEAIDAGIGYDASKSHKGIPDDGEDDGPGEACDADEEVPSEESMCEHGWSQAFCKQCLYLVAVEVD